LCQRISVPIQRFNAILISETCMYPSDDTPDLLAFICVLVFVLVLRFLYTLCQKNNNGLGCQCSRYFRRVPSRLHCSRAWSSSQTSSRQQGCKVPGRQGLEDTHNFYQFPSRLRDHGASKPLNWCEKSGDAPLSSQMTAEKPPSCFRDCPWLCRGEMRSHS